METLKQLAPTLRRNAWIFGFYVFGHMFIKDVIHHDSYPLWWTLIYSLGIGVLIIGATKHFDGKIKQAKTEAITEGARLTANTVLHAVKKAKGMT